jgi:hypothetical protein
MQVNSAFEGGFVTQFASDHLALPAIAPIPEPPSWMMLMAGIALFACASKTAQRKQMREAEGARRACGKFPEN